MVEDYRKNRRNAGVGVPYASDGLRRNIYMEQALPKRRMTRLPGYDYSTTGYYFITFCTKEKKCILSCVGRDDPGAPWVNLTKTGKIVDRYIQSIETAYSAVKVDKYVIMPNHVHVIIQINCREGGATGSSCPANMSDVIGCLKRYTNRETKEKLWQDSFYDHVIRNEEDYLRIWKYIDDNPAKWTEDKYYEA